MITVLACLALTLPPSLAAAYIWYIRSVTSFSIKEQQRAIADAGARRDVERETMIALDRSMTGMRERIQALEEIVREQQQTISILSDR